jgi:hypothetical protein
MEKSEVAGYYTGEYGNYFRDSLARIVGLYMDSFESFFNSIAGRHGSSLQDQENITLYIAGKKLSKNITLLQL